MSDIDFTAITQEVNLRTHIVLDRAIIRAIVDDVMTYEMLGKLTEFPQVAITAKSITDRILCQVLGGSGLNEHALYSMRVRIFRERRESNAIGWLTEAIDEMTDELMNVWASRIVYPVPGA